MMNLDYNVIKQIVKDLDKSINEHIIAKDLYNTNCQCHTPNQIGRCFICRINELIDNLDCLKSSLEPLSKNTINSIHFIDVESFCYTLGKQSNIDSISIEPVWEFKNDDWNINDNDNIPIGYSILAKYSRYTMNGMGYHVGYENVTYKWKAQSKRELGITGIPYLLSSWVVNPNEFEIESKDLPPNDNPEHDSDCEVYNNADWIVKMYNDKVIESEWTIDGNRNKSQAYLEAESEVLKHKQYKYTDWTLTRDNSFDNCNCADMFEGYYQPDDDFFYEEMNHILEQCDWIEAEFNSDTREWKLGLTSFNVAEYQSNPDYAQACNEEDGKPSFGDY